MLNFNKLRFLIIAFTIFIVNSSISSAIETIKINDKFNKSKILFAGFYSNDINLNQNASKIFNYIYYNLKTTGLFEIVSHNPSNQTPTSNPNLNPNSKPDSIEELLNSVENQAESTSLAKVNLYKEPDFEQLQKAGYSFFINSSFAFDQYGNIEVKLIGWDILDKNMLFGKIYSITRAELKKLANVISNQIYTASTGEEKGHFNSKLLYIAETGNIKKRTKRIALVDFDGENQEIYTDGTELVLTPYYSKELNKIFYLRYFKNIPQIYTLDYDNYTSRKLGNINATTFAAYPHPKDKNTILLSIIFDGNSDIYEYNIEENTAKRLTKSPAIDTTASYSPDGKTIAFSSDRGGSQQIYLMDRNGLNVRKITHESGSYSKPIYSPDGNWISFTKIKGGNFYIGIISPDSGSEKIITSAYLVEGANWSPNGRYLVYSKKLSPYKKGSIPRLYISDILTGYEFEVPTPKDEGASDPFWFGV